VFAATPVIAHPSSAGRAGSLSGTVIGIDPGHNGRNYSDPSFINHLVWNGRTMETCDTTGTATDGGYTEAQFNWSVASYLTADLKADGAKVVLTRHNNSGLGPCVNTRAHILDGAHVNVAIDIHADGGPPSGRGFAILEPIDDGVNAKVIAPSDRFARILRSSFEAGTGMPLSTYDGIDGLQPRNDLAGLNLTTVPKVLIECGNMRNSTDARLLSSSSFQKKAAAAIAAGMIKFLGR
jgi:N-acetylmuramoyl-L-alanine amidase